MRTLSRWQYQYLGTKDFPPIISELELYRFFTFTPAEISEIRSRYKSNLRIAAAIQLGFLRMTGATLDKIRIIPSSVLKHIGKQLELPAPTIASLRAIYRARRATLYEHQVWAIEKGGFQRPTDKQFAKVLSHLQKEARYKADVNALVESGKVWLYQHSFVFPGDRPVRDYARQALAQSEEGLCALITSSIPETSLRFWERQVLQTRQDTGTTWLEWLALPPCKGNITALRQRIDRIDFLKKLKVDQFDLAAIPTEKIRIYGAELRRMRPAKFRELKDPTRTLRLVCFLKWVLMETTDTAVLMAGKQVARLWREAYQEAKNLEAEKVLSSRDMLNDIFAMADDNAFSDRIFRVHVQALKEQQAAPVFPTRAAATRWLLTEPGNAIRSLLFELQKLDLSFGLDSPFVHSFELLKGLYAHHQNDLPSETYCHTAKGWRFIIEGLDRERALRALEADTLFGLRKGLRSGSIWINSSGAFRNRDELLISRGNWDKERTRHYTKLNIPLNASDYLDRLCDALQQKLGAVAEAVENGNLTIDEGTVRIPRLKPEIQPAEVNRKREQLFKKIGVAQLPDIILDVDSQAGVSRAILGRPPVSEQELLKVYAGMLAHGTSIDASALSLMIPQIEAQQVLSGMKLFEDAVAVRAANEAVSSYQRQFPVIAAWGDGSLASSDMMSLDVSRKIWQARLDPKRRIASIGTYTHVSDFWSVIYDQPIMLNERQAGAALEGVIRQREINIDRLAVDTHGYTDFAMGQAKFQGIDLCPRLKSMRDRKLHVPSGIRLPPALTSISTGAVHLNVVRKYWDELVRIAASIETGQVTAPIALGRFGAAAAGDPVYRAGVYLGRLVRSIFLCDYFTSESFRRTINRILVHGEAVHQLQRAICMGSFSKPRGQREEELVALSGSLTLLTNICLAWTTSRIQAVLREGQGEQSQDKKIEWLKAVSPAHFRNINFRGTFRFDINQYAERLMFRDDSVSKRNR